MEKKGEKGEKVRNGIELEENKDGKLTENAISSGVKSAHLLLVSFFPSLQMKKVQKIFPSQHGFIVHHTRTNIGKSK
jgi:hypothetical protein